MFESSSLHEQKNLADSTHSTGSPTLNSTISASGESHEDVLPASADSLPKLQFHADRLSVPLAPTTYASADEDLVSLTGSVDVAHAADQLAVRFGQRNCDCVVA